MADILLNTSGRKSIKKEMILKYMMAEGLAYWFMDDGGKSCYNKNYFYKGFVYNTQGFSKEEVMVAVLELSQKCNLHTSLAFNRQDIILY